MFLIQPGPDARPVQMNAVLVAVSSKDREVIALVVDQDGRPWLPSRPVGDGETSAVAAVKLLEDLTGMTARTGPGTSGWLDLVLVDVHDNPGNDAGGVRQVYAIYGVMFPYESRTKARWARLAELVHGAPEVAQCIAEVARKL